MDFTEVYQHSSSLVAFSPGAHFLATAAHDRLIVRRADSFQITRSWRCDDAPSETHTLLNSSKSINPETRWITHIGWSCDSEYLFAACAKLGFVQVFKLRDEEWSARIDAGVEGLLKAEWSPDGRTILCFSEWGLRITMWSLVTGNATYVQYPVHPDRGYAFRADGRYFVLAERHKSKDTLGVYDVSQSYNLVRHFPLPTTSISSLSLSPNGNHLAVWEGPLEYKLHILSLAGSVVGSFTPEPDPGFGIRGVAWHPTGMFIAVGGWDDKVYILDSMSWCPVTTFEVTGHLPASTLLWREPAHWLDDPAARGFLTYDRLEGPQTIPVNRTDHSKAMPKMGALQLEWNKTGTLLMIRFENVPNAVYIYDFPGPTQEFQPKLRSVLLNSSPILQARWNPLRTENLALCTGLRSLYTWSSEWVGENGVEEEMAECIGVPAAQFQTKEFRWAPDGKGVALMDKSMFCCAFEVQEEDA
ncbi:hypothetical protein ONZ45_g4900 [Pleurotus djamor]|nr:hypothetical protein ONZ45_g4900 [Pleurotus djamor]